ncbi:MAG: T9SS type A sorting domain-containing protein [Ignavibacteriales bacterium]|nr:T9SS type A sorting domain-containing protein [Ignavibacteriales bacterium]
MVTSTDGGNTWVNRKMSGYYFYRVCIASDSIFYASTSGSLIRFRDFGAARSTIGSSVGKSLAIKDSLLISAGSEGNIWWSTNEGINWGNFRQGHNYEFYFPEFIDRDTGFATAGYPGYLKKTTDGGKNWSDLPSLLNQNVNNPVFLSDKKSGVVIKNYSVILHTSDGGGSWQLTNVSLPLGTRFRRVWFLDDSTGFVLSEDTTFYRTDNGGVAWKRMVVTPPVYRMYDINFLNKNTGFIASRRNTVYKTDDGGSTWRRVNFNIYNNNEYADARINFIDDSTGFVYGWGMDDIKTTDGGETWSVNHPSKNYGKIDFYDRLNGVAFGENSNPGAYNSIDITRDGGRSWTKYNTFIDYVSSIVMVDLKTFLLTGPGGVVIRATDLGYTSIEDDKPTMISGYQLFNNYPNPFNPSTVISFNIPEREKVSLLVYDITGKMVAKLIEGVEMSTGKHEITFDADGLASGVYLQSDYPQNKHGW